MMPWKALLSWKSSAWALGATLGLALGSPSQAAPLAADKLIALVRADHCDRVQLQASMTALGNRLARNRRLTRVSLDWPADPVRNLDLMGNPSPFAAAMEVSATGPALANTAERVRRELAKVCPTDVYLVHERRLITTPRTWPLGTPSPEAKVMNTLIRNEGMSFDQFDAEWSGPHARLALAWRRLRGGNSHYVQNPVVGSVGTPSQAYDGIGEVEGASSIPVSDEIRKARIETAAHARTFHHGGPMFIVRETILKD